MKYRDIEGQIVEVAEIIEFIENRNQRLVKLSDGRVVDRPRVHGGAPQTGDFHVKPCVSVDGYAEDIPAYVVGRKAFAMFYTLVPEDICQPSV